MEREQIQFGLMILDGIFGLAVTILVISLGIRIIGLVFALTDVRRIPQHLVEFFRDFKAMFMWVIILAFVFAAIVKLTFGLPFELLFDRYIAEGFSLLPQLYKEFIEPIFRKLG